MLHDNEDTVVPRNVTVDDDEDETTIMMRHGQKQVAKSVSVAQIFS